MIPALTNKNSLTAKLEGTFPYNNRKPDLENLIISFHKFNNY